MDKNSHLHTYDSSIVTNSRAHILVASIFSLLFVRFAYLHDNDEGHVNIERRWSKLDSALRRRNTFHATCYSFESNICIQLCVFVTTQRWRHRMFIYSNDSWSYDVTEGVNLSSESKLSSKGRLFAHINRKVESFDKHAIWRDKTESNSQVRHTPTSLRIHCMVTPASLTNAKDACARFQLLLKHNKVNTKLASSTSF